MARDKLAEARSWLTNPSRLDKTEMIKALRGMPIEVLVKAYDIWWGTYSSGIQRAPSNRKIDGIQQGVREKDATAASEAATRAVLDFLRKDTPVVTLLDDDPLLTDLADQELAGELAKALDALQESVPRLAQAIVRKRFPDNGRAIDIRHATENAERALAILAEDVEALNFTDAARAARRAEQAVERIWGKAKHKYQQWAGASRGNRFQAIIPWDMLPQDVRDMWFGLADDRVPPTWDELTPDQRADFSQRHARQALSPAQIHTQKRARGLRRRAYRQIEHANPYTVRSPEQRMHDIAATAQTLSWAKIERAAGRMNDLQFEVWAEHHRRAYHAYTHPTDPYPEAP